MLVDFQGNGVAVVVVVVVNSGGGVREITYYRHTKKELYYIVQSMNNMLRNELDTKLLTETTDKYDKSNTWEHLDKFDNSHECESKENK